MSKISAVEQNATIAGAYCFPSLFSTDRQSDRPTDRSTDRSTDQPRRVDIEAPSPELKNYQLEILTTVHQAQPMRIYKAEKFELSDCGLAMDHLHLALSVGWWSDIFEKFQKL